jgi:hypothetical protein
MRNADCSFLPCQVSTYHYEGTHMLPRTPAQIIPHNPISIFDQTQTSIKSLHELASHVEQTTHTAGGTARRSAARSSRAALEVHLQSHLGSLANDVLLVEAAGGVALGALLVEQLGGFAHCDADHLVLAALAAAGAALVEHFHCLLGGMVRDFFFITG